MTQALVATPDARRSTSASRKTLALEVQQYRNLMHFVRAGDVTVAWRRTPGRVLQISTALRNPGDPFDFLVAQQIAGRRMLDGSYIMYRVPRGTNVRRWLQRMFFMLP